MHYICVEFTRAIPEFEVPESDSMWSVNSSRAVEHCSKFHVMLFGRKRKMRPMGPVVLENETPGMIFTTFLKTRENTVSSKKFTAAFFL